MRVSDDDFAALTLLHDFESYYAQLSVEEMIDELQRIHTTGHKLVALYQQLSMHKRFSDIACFDLTLAEHQRSALIGIITNFRETLDRTIIPEIDERTASLAKNALAANDDYIDRYSYYPRAAEMIRVSARKPTGPYELGPIGKIMERDMAPETWHVITGEWGTSQEQRSRELDTRENALRLACDYIRNRERVLRIESHRGVKMTLEEIERWCKEHPSE